MSLRPPQPKGQQLQLLIERQRIRLEKNRLIAETRRLAEEQQYQEASNKRLELEKIENDKRNKIERKKKQTRHLDNWNTHFNSTINNHHHATSISLSSTALSPSTPIIHLPPPLQENQDNTTTTTTITSNSQYPKTAKLITRKRGARRNVTPIVPYSAEVILAAQYEMLKMKQINKETIEREYSIRRGPFVSSTWMKSIRLLQQAANGNGMYTSTSYEQRTNGSSSLLTPVFRSIPLRPNENIKEDEHENTKQKEQEEQEQDLQPVWRTDLLPQHKPNNNTDNNTDKNDASISTISVEYVSNALHTTYVDDTIKDRYLSKLECRRLFIDEKKRFYIVSKPFRMTLEKKYYRDLLSAWLMLWKHVEQERARMFRLGESRLNHRKARKHYWFVVVVHYYFIQKWKNYYMSITKKEYSDRILKAYSYWLHASEAKAFRGWKSAVDRGLALRRIIQISIQWKKRYLLGSFFKAWNITSKIIQIFTVKKMKCKKEIFQQWLLYIEISQNERRFLLRAGRRWRMSNKSRLFVRWKIKMNVIKRLKLLFTNLMYKHDNNRYKFGFEKIKNYNKNVLQKKDVKTHQHNELCDCLQRFGTRQQRKENRTATGNSTNGKGKRRRRRRRVVGVPLRPFRCTMESHLERRLMDANEMIADTLKLSHMKSLSDVVEVDIKEKQEQKINNRRASTVERRSHWM